MVCKRSLRSQKCDYIGRVEVSTYMRDDRKVARDADSAINVVLVEVTLPNFITREVF